jgi:hypothetical protein
VDVSDLLVRPRAGRGGRARDRPAASPYPLAAAGAGAALWAAILGITGAVVVVLVAWAADSASGAGFGDALRTALAAWLYAHHTGIAVPGGNLGLVPLGLLAIPAIVLVRAGRGLARTRPRETGGSVGTAGRAVVVLAVPYALLAGLAGLLAGTTRVQPSTSQAMLGAGLLAAVFGGYGVLAETGVLGRYASRLPDVARPVLRGASAAMAALLAAGALVAIVALAAHAGRYADLVASLHAGTVGWILLLLLTVALLPNAAIFGAAFLAGPGFAVGAGTAVTPYGVHLGAVPALPILAALPAGPDLPWPVPLAVVLPIAAGVLAGIVVERGTPGGRVLRAASWAAAAGGAAGVGMAVLAGVAGGPIGGGALAAVGPSAWLTGCAVAVEVGVAAAATASLRRWRRSRPH